MLSRIFAAVVFLWVTPCAAERVNFFEPRRQSGQIVPPPSLVPNLNPIPPVFTPLLDFTVNLNLPPVQCPISTDISRAYNLEAPLNDDLYPSTVTVDHLFGPTSLENKSNLSFLNALSPIPMLEKSYVDDLFGFNDCAEKTKRYPDFNYGLEAASNSLAHLNEGSQVWHHGKQNDSAAPTLYRFVEYRIPDTKRKTPKKVWALQKYGHPLIGEIGYQNIALLLDSDGDRFPDEALLQGGSEVLRARQEVDPEFFGVSSVDVGSFSVSTGALVRVPLDRSWSDKGDCTAWSDPVASLLREGQRHGWNPDSISFDADVVDELVWKGFWSEAVARSVQLPARTKQALTRIPANVLKHLIALKDLPPALWRLVSMAWTKNKACIQKKLSQSPIVAEAIMAECLAEITVQGSRAAYNGLRDAFEAFSKLSPEEQQQIILDQGLTLAVETVLAGTLKKPLDALRAAEGSSAVVQTAASTGRVAVDSTLGVGLEDVTSRGGAHAARQIARHADLPPAHRLADGMAHFGVNPGRHWDLVNKNNLVPSARVSTPQGDFVLSDVFDIGGGRQGVLARIETPDGSFLRSYYRSNSQGTWRVLPARNHGSFAPGFDKGPTEFALGPPTEVQAHLAARSASGNVRVLPEGDATEIFEGAVRHNHSWDDYDAYTRRPDTIANQVTVRSLLEKNWDGAGVPPPQSVRIENFADRPDFSKAVQTYQTRTSVAGDVDAFVYASRDGSLHYTIFKDSQGRAWVAEITTRRSPLSTYGTPTEAVSGADLAAPLWEYRSQIHRDFLGPSHPSLGQYSSNWNYVRQLPEIQEWYRAQGLEIPPAESLRPRHIQRVPPNGSEAFPPGYLQNPTDPWKPEAPRQNVPAP